MIATASMRRWLVGALFAMAFLAFATIPAHAVEVGDQAPAFSLVGQDQTYSPGQLRGEKQAVLIFFRGLW